jgi:RNA polymerase sigma-70 factor (ECF subfamily)
MQLALVQPLMEEPVRHRHLRLVSGAGKDGQTMTSEDRQDPDELLQRIAQGDRQAFADLFILLAPKVKAYLMRLGNDPASAEDLTQDVMVAVWRKAGQFDAQRASALTWVFVIARNRRIDSLRREDSAVTYGHAPPEMRDEAELADGIVAGKQTAALMRKAMKGLAAEQQEVIRRSFFEDEPHSAIAAALDLPLGTVKSRLRIAFDKLRLQMEDSQ